MKEMAEEHQLDPRHENFKLVMRRRHMDQTNLSRTLFRVWNLFPSDEKLMLSFKALLSNEDADKLQRLMQWK